MGYSKICFRIARGRARDGGPAIVLVRSEYLRSDSERKLLIGHFDLTHVKCSRERSLIHTNAVRWDGRTKHCTL